ncbi:MAG: DEAD/DEAH box helicase [Bacteroidetes bacterium]|nr:MAG: DEAD/DEAH box helicase [Bacteroidota bacterium]
MPFTELGLHSDLLYALEKQFYVSPTPIQEKAIPEILKGKDVLGIAQTGSGKTAAYVLPTLQLLQGKPVAKNRHINTLVLVPTRELAIQVQKVYQSFSQWLPQHIKPLAVYGGVSINPQMIALQGVEILVATPGRLLELVEKKSVYLSNVEVLILDEADKILNLGFKEEINQVLALLPKKRQNLLFSATLSTDLTAIKEVLLHHPVTVEVEAETQNLDLITQLAYIAEDERKGPLLRYLIKQHGMQQVLVFASSVHRADAIADKLNANKIKAIAMHSKKSQGGREDALRKFKNGEVTVLVATDLMSRGIDIPFLPFVVNYELPRSPKDYVHRIGRTGRAENAGTAISLVNTNELHHFNVIQKKMKTTVALTDSFDMDLRGY